MYYNLHTVIYYQVLFFHIFDNYNSHWMTGTLYCDREGVLIWGVGSIGILYYWMHLKNLNWLL